MRVDMERGHVRARSLLWWCSWIIPLVIGAILTLVDVRAGAPERLLVTFWGFALLVLAWHILIETRVPQLLSDRRRTRQTWVTSLPLAMWIVAATMVVVWFIYGQ